jgi:serine/threonine protein kinase
VAKSKHSGKFYALKMQRKDYIIEHRQQDYVLYEYKLLMELSHPNIMTVSLLADWHGYT